MRPHPPGQPVLLSLGPDDPDWQALTGLTAALARDALERPVELDVQAVDRSGHWAFVRARLCEAGGAALSLEGTRFAGAAAVGGTSDLAAALFRLEGEADGRRWTLVDQAILPTDVAWLGWPQAHGAPSQLLGIGG